MFPPNARVRLKGDPTRCGFVTGKTRPGWHGGEPRYQVRFADMKGYVPADQLEAVPSEPETPVDLFEAGKLGCAADLRRTLTHMRLTGRLADVIYSMEATNTDYYPYQFKPVLRFLMSPSNALLIADEVGLGKTIEAGLIWTELRSRFDLRRLLILCPSVLCEKWKRELAGKIGVRAEIVDAHGLQRRLSDPGSELHGFALICSLQGARPPRDSRLEESNSGAAKLAKFLSEEQAGESGTPLIDLLVIDEAHYLRNPETQTHKLGLLLRPLVDNLLLLSATPIHNKNTDLFSLLQLLDGDTFERLEDLSVILTASEPLVAARDEILGPSPSAHSVLGHLQKASIHPLLQNNRQLQFAIEQLSQPDCLKNGDHRSRLSRRLETINPLAYLITRTRKRDIQEWRVVREPNAEAIPMTSVEADFYRVVTDFVIDYAMSRDANERFILAMPQRQMASSMAATLRAWQQGQENVVEDEDENSERPEADQAGPLRMALMSQAADFGDPDELAANDSKYHRLREILQAFFAEHAAEKVVLFSTFRQTLNYLSARLNEDGISNDVMHGSVAEPKDAILHRFEHDPNIRVLLSSEVGSEGIDLQFCRVLINYDLPWNPMRIEQRIGRLDRLGQAASRILIWNLFFAGTIDARIYDRLYEKLDLCRRALGDFENILGDEIRQLTTDLLSDHLSDAQQGARIEQTVQALANLRSEQDHLEAEAAHLVAYGDYILNEVRAAKQLNRWITAEDLQAYTTDFFTQHYTGSTFRQRAPESPDFEVQLSNQAKQDLQDYIRSKKLSTTRLMANAAHPVRCRFESKASAGESTQTELITQFHPLIRFVSHEIRRREEQITPAVAVRMRAAVADDAFRPGNYLLSAARWSFQGLQDIEKLVFAAHFLGPPSSSLDAQQSEQLAYLCAQHGTDWFEARNAVDCEALSNIADEELFGRIDQEYQEYAEEMRRQNEDRADLQLRNLRRHRDKQLRKLEEVLEKHRSLGREGPATMTAGRIKALQNRIERREMEIDRRRGVIHRSDEILIALINIV